MSKINSVGSPASVFGSGSEIDGDTDGAFDSGVPRLRRLRIEGAKAQIIRINDIGTGPNQILIRKR